ncbi:MAG: hypothetical protein ACK53Y_14345 [bacterium]
MPRSNRPSEHMMRRFLGIKTDRGIVKSTSMSYREGPKIFSDCTWPALHSMQKKGAGSPGDVANVPLSHTILPMPTNSTKG